MEETYGSKYIVLSLCRVYFCRKSTQFVSTNPKPNKNRFSLLPGKYFVSFLPVLFPSMSSLFMLQWLCLLGSWKIHFDARFGDFSIIPKRPLFRCLFSSRCVILTLSSTRKRQLSFTIHSYPAPLYFHHFSFLQKQKTMADRSFYVHWNGFTSSKSLHYPTETVSFFSWSAVQYCKLCLFFRQSPLLKLSSMELK